MRGVLALLLTLAAPARAENLPPPDTTGRPTAQAPAAALAAWTEAIRPAARAAGIPQAVLDEVLATVVWLPEVIESDRRQNEFTRTIWDYLERAVSAERIAAGQAALARHADLLARIERETGVDRAMIVAIWGIESSYGAVRGDVPVFAALATLAADGRRGAFFSAEFIAALSIVAGGHARPGDLRGSWAGAMGHVQFLPSTWQAHAVDADGDGRRDIWSDDPADALASAAAYLRANGWIAGQPWGLEVALPEGFDWQEASAENWRPVAWWTARGVRAADGGTVPNHGLAAILLPGGADGAAFLVFHNFTVLETYNSADAYVIALGHLADRLTGGGPILHDWPRHERALSWDERLELQRLLTASGFDTQGIDGLIGPRTQAAIRGWQAAHGWRSDAFPSLSLLEALR
ncbi:MAG: lytic murein transglycosylase [Rubellimicrobium sp.]|nr:lytic murein transglycosylase [Rubellimicrobium sp.]